MAAKPNFCVTQKLGSRAVIAGRQVRFRATQKLVVGGLDRNTDVFHDPHMTNTNVSTRLATIRTHPPWPWAIGWALIPVLFTAIGFRYAQSQQFDDRRTYLATAAAVTAAALVGLIRMLSSRIGPTRAAAVTAAAVAR